MEIKNRTRSNLATALAIFAFSVSSTARADDYLDALENEASEASIDQESIKNITSSSAPIDPDSPVVPSATDTPAITSGASTITQTQFEATLKVKKRGSFLWYSRLEKEQKELVYQDFLAGTDMEALGNKILKLFTQR